jgi:hypothetical protein
MVLSPGTAGGSGCRSSRRKPPAGGSFDYWIGPWWWDDWNAGLQFLTGDHPTHLRLAGFMRQRKGPPSETAGRLSGSSRIPSLVRSLARHE